MARTTTPGSSPRVVTAVRLPAHLHAELQSQAEERDVSINFLITRAVEHYLKQLGPADPLAESEGGQRHGQGVPPEAGKDPAISNQREARR